MHYLVLPVCECQGHAKYIAWVWVFNKRQYGKWCFLREVAVLVMYHKKPVVMIGAPVWLMRLCFVPQHEHPPPNPLSSHLKKVYCFHLGWCALFFFCTRGKNRKKLTVMILISSGPTHSLCHTGCIRVRLCELPRAAIPDSDIVSRGWGDAGQRVPLDHYV